jgi:hypothetical protein
VPANLIIEPGPDDPHAPKFDYGPHLPARVPILLQPDPDENQSWREQLGEALKSEALGGCLANLVMIPPRSLRDNVLLHATDSKAMEGTRVCAAPRVNIRSERVGDAPAFLARIMHSAADGQVVAALASAQVLLTKPFRSAATRAASRCPPRGVDHMV